MRFDANVWAHFHYHGRRSWAMLQVVVRGEREDRVMTELFSEQAAAELPRPVEVLRLDVTEPEQFDSLREELGSRWDAVDGVLHAIAYAPDEALGGKFLQTSAKAAMRAFEVSAFSYKALAD